MAIKLWTVEEFVNAARDHARREFDDDEGLGFNTYLGSVLDLAGRAHKRGDGVAVYVNSDLGHPDIGQWQVVSYGNSEAQLETRYEEARTLPLPQTTTSFVHGNDIVPKTLPDIGGRINWRYSLEAVCPSFEQQVDAADLGLTYKIVRFYRDGLPRKIIKTGLTLAEAQEHCRQDNTHGDGWFDGHEIEV